MFIRYTHFVASGKPLDQFLILSNIQGLSHVELIFGYTGNAKKGICHCLIFRLLNEFFVTLVLRYGFWVNPRKLSLRYRKINSLIYYFCLYSFLVDIHALHQKLILIHNISLFMQLFEKNKCNLNFKKNFIFRPTTLRLLAFLSRQTIHDSETGCKY